MPTSPHLRERTEALDDVGAGLLHDADILDKDDEDQQGNGADDKIGNDLFHNTLSFAYLWDTGMGVTISLTPSMASIRTTVPAATGAAVGAAGRPFHAGQADRAGLMQIVDGLRDDGLAADVPGGVRADGARPQVLFSRAGAAQSAVRQTRQRTA